MPPFFSPKRESRFQRLFTRRSEFLGRRPRLVVNCAVGASARRWNARCPQRVGYICGVAA